MGERPADVATAVGTLVSGLQTVLDDSTAVAVQATVAEFGVEGVEDLRGGRCQLDLADDRDDVHTGEVLVGRLRRPLNLKKRRVLLQELGDCRRGPRVQLLVDLHQQTPEGLVRLILGERSRWDDLSQVVPLFRHGSRPAVTRTRSEPLGRISISPRCLARRRALVLATWRR
jgi:hypothetical protein